MPLLGRADARAAWPALALCALMLASGCESPERHGAAPAVSSAAPAPQKLDLLFTYGSEKQAWIEDVTRSFNASGARTRSGRPIQVEAVPLGSGESIDELLDGRRHAHL